MKNTSRPKRLSLRFGRGRAHGDFPHGGPLANAQVADLRRAQTEAEILCF